MQSELANGGEECGRITHASGEKEDEGRVVPPPDAVVDPLTVMIASIDTIITLYSFVTFQNTRFHQKWKSVLTRRQ